MTGHKNLTKTHGPFFLSAYFMLFVTGLEVLSAGAVLPDIVEEFHINYDMAGLLLSFLAAGNMTALIVSGYLSDLIGRKIILLAGSVMIAAGFLVITGVSSVTALAVLIFIAGCGWGISNIISGIVNDITGGSVKHLNRLHIFFAAGAFTAPFFVIFASALGAGWRTVLSIIGILAACSAVFFAVIKFPATQISRQKQKNAKSRVSFEAFKHTRYYIFLIIAFTYTAVETVMNGWITTYFQGTGILTNIQAKVALSLVWVSIMTGRIILSFAGDKIKKESLILICASAVLIFSVVLIQLYSFICVAACIFALGLGLAAVIPTNIANAETVVQGSGTALGILLSSGGLGAAAGPVITGMMAEHLSLTASMWSAAGFALILVIAAWINFILGRKKANHL